MDRTCSTKKPPWPGMRQAKNSRWGGDTTRQVQAITLGSDFHANFLPSLVLSPPFPPLFFTHFSRHHDNEHFSFDFVRHFFF
jgi:hypothetical protein